MNRPFLVGCYDDISAKTRINCQVFPAGYCIKPVSYPSSRTFPSRKTSAIFEVSVSSRAGFCMTPENPAPLNSSLSFFFGKSAGQNHLDARIKLA